MKKIFASIGLAAAGTASLHAYALLDAGDDKVWDVAATLRGFYDDNYVTSSAKQSSIGFELTPTFQLNMPLQQTEIGLKYTYGLYYYQKREELGQNPIDQTHQFDLWVDHAFTPRWDLQFGDTVTVAQDPALVNAGTAKRVEGNNLVNTAHATLTTDWTRKFSTALSYQNTFVRYDNSGGTAITPSYAGLLNRVDQTFGLEGQWHFSRTTVGLVGYNFEIVNYTGNEPIAVNTVPPFQPYFSSIRDNMSHIGYVGAQHAFLENLSGSAKAGVQYTTDYKDPNSTKSLGPYADMSLIYTYAAGSYMQIGFTERRNATDAVGVDSSGRITQDQESSVLYGSINHPLTPKLTGSIVGDYQHSIYHDGAFNNGSADFYSLGLNLAYAFNRHFSSDVGYNFNYYKSAAGGNYTRNVIYLGVTASY